MTTWRTPAGWGIGIPLGDTFRDDAKETARERIQRVMAATDADWYQTWTAQSFNGADPQFVPASEAGDVAQEKLAVTIDGCLLVLCEPERGWNPAIATPTKAVRATIQQLQALDSLHTNYAWAAPGSNINGKNLDWLTEYAALLWQRGSKAPTFWAIHLYGRKVADVNHHLQRFWQWHAKYGLDRPVVVSEFGPGGGASQAEALAMMEFGRRVLDDQRVLGVAYFAAGTGYLGHPDVCADEALLRRFRELG